MVALSGSTRGFATPEEFVAQAQKVMDAPIDAKIGFLFRLHDTDGDGWIHKDELERLLHIAAAEHDLELDAREIDELVSGVLAVGDQNADERISLIEFVQILPYARLAAPRGVLLRPGRARARGRAELQAARAAHARRTFLSLFQVLADEYGGNCTFSGTEGAHRVNVTMDTTDTANK